MNERIKELAYKAGLHNHLWLDISDSDDVLDTVKFAELIIQKCISQIALIGISNFENEDIMWTVETAISSIKEHFGVEQKGRWDDFFTKKVDYE